MENLSEAGFGAIGTIRVNIIDKCPLIAVNTLKNQPRGAMDHQLDSTSNIVMVRWSDNSVVTLASTVYGVNPLSKASLSVADKQHIEIDQPATVKAYNHNMGGTDRMDQNIACYRSNIRSKKW